MSNDSAAPIAPSPEEAIGWECSQPPGQSIEGGFEKHSEASSTAGGTLSAYDLVTRVLDHPEGGVGALIELANDAETDWLEFRATMISRPEDRKNPKENHAGHRNVREAVRIASVIASVEWLETGEPSLQTCALESLNGGYKCPRYDETLEAVLPTVALKVHRIREVLTNSTGAGLMDEILGMLPFNYR